MPVGKGAPFFGSVESRLSSMLFSVPADKGRTGWRGSDFAGMFGDEANDEFYMEGKDVKTFTNDNAGIKWQVLSHGMRR